MKIWFMFDNHTFERIEESDLSGMIDHAVNLFAEDGCGSIFVRDEHDGEIKSLTLDGYQMPNGRWGMPKDKIKKWANKIVAERSFRTLMV